MHPTLLKSQLQPPPSERSRTTVRIISAPHQLFVWITTGDDHVSGNGQFDGHHLLVGVGQAEATAEDVEVLETHGITGDVTFSGALTTAPSIGALAQFKARSGAWTHAGDAAQRYDIGSEVNAQPLRGATGVPLGLVLRLVDMRLLIVDGRTPTESLRAALARAPDGRQANVIITNGSIGDEIGLEPEVSIGPANGEHTPVVLHLPPSGEALTFTMDGGEAELPGHRYRDRSGYWVECESGTCSGTFSSPTREAFFIPIRIGGTLHTFLADTRSHGSYVDAALIDQLTLHHEDHDEHSSGGHAHSFRLPHELRPAEVGGAIVRGLHVGSVPTQTVAGHRIAGVLGRDVLGAFSWELHNCSQAPKGFCVTSTLVLPQAPPDELGSPAIETRDDTRITQIPMDFSPAGPLILAHADEKPISWIVATASAHTLWSAATPSTQEVTPLVQPSLNTEDPYAVRWETLPNGRKAMPTELHLRTLDTKMHEGWAVYAPDRPLQTDLLGMDYLAPSPDERVLLDFRGRMLTRTQSSGRAAQK